MLPPWSSSTIYQIFPLSYMDANNDGKGDFQGIIQKLDYVQELGVDTIWLNPIYQSNWVDEGYDILDHTKIDLIFGTMSDLDELIRQAHKRQLKIMLDLLPNHTSDQHPWFIESASSKTNPKRNWYTWHDPTPDGEPPNNWKAVFGGSAWTFDSTTQQYYLHTFYPQQPDLNLANPHVRQAIYSIMKFYLNRGVDAFRIDAASHFIKDPQFRDNPLKPNWQQIDDQYEQQEHLYDKNLDARFEFINELSSVLEQFPHAYMITESYLDLPQLTTLYKHTNHHNHTACNFHFIQNDLNPIHTANFINQYLNMCHKQKVTPTWILGNHDRTRVVSRFGILAARALALLQLTLPGIAFIYYGDEIGMSETPIPPSFRHDLYTFFDRDAQRTPMHWDNSTNAGFSKNEPWLPINENYTQINVEDESNSPTSFLQLYKELLKIRNSFQSQEISKINIINKSILHYTRDKYEILINLSPNTVSPCRECIYVENTVKAFPTASTYGNEIKKTNLLRPYEGIIIQK